MINPLSNALGPISATPFYPEFGLYNMRAGAARAWDFNGWKPESLSWKKTCYIHAGLSGMGSRVTYRGPEAARFLASICTNGFEKFRVGTVKHAVFCTHEGLIATHGVLQRKAEDEFCLFAAGLWVPFQYSRSSFDVEQVFDDCFIMQVAGPNSLATLRQATGEDLTDIAFLRYRESRIAGRDVLIMRVGMAGTLAYEVQGPMSEAAEVYQAIFEAGQNFGIQRLGWKTYGVNHVEGGFPQQSWTFLGAFNALPEFTEFANGGETQRHMPAFYTGSIDPSNKRARFRTPVEVGWESSVKLDHEFLGRDAVEAELASPARTIVTLEWNSDDVMDVYASHFRGEGEDFSYLGMPTAPEFRQNTGHADEVMLGGRRVGISSSAVYSYHFRKVISHCTIDRDAAAIGTDLVVRWGEYGGRIKDIRAKVGRFPYLSEGRNQAVDVRTS